MLVLQVFKTLLLFRKYFGEFSICVSIFIGKFCIQWGRKGRNGTFQARELMPFSCLPIYCEKPNQWVAIFYLLAASSFSMSLFNLANAASLLSLHTLDKGIRCPDQQLSPSLVEILQGHCRTHACLQSSHLVVVYLFSYLYLVHMHCILYLHNVSVFP